MGWGDAQLAIPDSVEPLMAGLIRSCWADPADRPSFAQLIGSLKSMAQARSLFAPVQPQDCGMLWCSNLRESKLSSVTVTPAGYEYSELKVTRWDGILSNCELMYRLCKHITHL